MAKLHAGSLLVILHPAQHAEPAAQSLVLDGICE